MRDLKNLFDNNRNWVKTRLTENPDFFKKMVAIQNPKYLWIGCSDSRMPPNEIVGLAPGELFVHRNVANLVLHTDINCLSVVQFAIEVLKVRHIIVCGHYGCSGVEAAMENKQHGLIDHWLCNIKDLHHDHRQELSGIQSHDDKFRRLCELNVHQQVHNLCYTQFVQNAWDRGQPLSVHGWIYDLADGLLRDLNLCLDDPKDIDALYRLKMDR